MPAKVIARRISTPRSVKSFNHAGKANFWSDRPLFADVPASSSSPSFGLAFLFRFAAGFGAGEEPSRVSSVFALGGMVGDGRD